MKPVVLSFAILAVLACAAALPATSKPAKKEEKPSKPEAEASKEDDDGEVMEFFLPLSSLFGGATESESDDESGSSEVNPFAARTSPFNFFFNPFSFIRAPDFSNLFRDVAIEPTKDSDTKLINSTVQNKVMNGHKVQVKTSEYYNNKTDTSIKTVFVNYGTDDETSEERPITGKVTPKQVKPKDAKAPIDDDARVDDTEDKKMEDNEVKERVEDHEADNGKDLTA